MIVNDRPIAWLTLSLMNGFARFQSNVATATTSSTTSASNTPALQLSTFRLRFILHSSCDWPARVAVYDDAPPLVIAGEMKRLCGDGRRFHTMFTRRPRPCIRGIGRNGAIDGAGAAYWCAVSTMPVGLNLPAGYRWRYVG